MSSSIIRPMGYFSTAQEAEAALTNFLSKEDK